MPTLEDRKRLGQVVQYARVDAGYRHVKGEWADYVGYTDRHLGDLERGRTVGPNVFHAVEKALGWPPGWCRRILTGEVNGPPSMPGAAAVRDRTTITLALATQDELLDELASRRRTSTNGD
jgi:hypothetical protein